MSQPLLPMEDFVKSFRSQFIFQAGKGGLRKGGYYTAYNQERGLPNDCWAMMTFITVAPLYGFNEEEIRTELHVSPSKFERLKEEVVQIMKPEYPDRRLRETILVKSGLVKNCILINHRIRLPRRVSF